MKEVNEAFGDIVYRVDALEVAKELDESRSCFGDKKNKSKENAVFYLRSQYEQIQLLTKHAKELQSSLESLEKDAARYRWVRMTYSDDGMEFWPDAVSFADTPDKLDAAIDAAMQSANKGE